MKFIKYIVFAVAFIPLAGLAQQESDDIRAGNKLYKDKKYTEAEIEYRKALQKNSKSFEANYNLGNALFRQGKYDKALEQYQNAVPLAASDKQKTAYDFHNLGNTFMSGGKLQEAISAYKMALKSNPKDNETRYNLAYINHHLHAGVNGRVVGYDNAHGYHHRHYFDVVEPIAFVSFEDVEERFERDWLALKDKK